MQSVPFFSLFFSSFIYFPLLNEGRTDLNEPQIFKNNLYILNTYRTLQSTSY